MKRFLLYTLFAAMLIHQSANSEQLIGRELDPVNQVDFDIANPQTIENLLHQLESIAFNFNQSGYKQVSLEKAISLAISFNPSIKASSEDISAQRWNLLASQQEWLPKFSLNSGRIPSYSEANRRTKIYLNNQESTSSSSSFGSTLRLNGVWTFLSPTRQPNINSFAYQLNADELLFITNVRDLVFEVQSSYYKLQGLSLLIRDYAEIVSSSQKTYDAILAKYQTGYANILQLEQAKSTLASSLVQLIDYHIQYSDVSYALSRLVGLPDYVLLAPEDSLQLVDAWPLSLNDSLEKGLINNERIQRSIALADAAKWRGYLELNRVLPSLSFNIYGEASNTTAKSYTQRQLVDNQWNLSSDLGAYLSLEWRFFDGGVNYSNAKSSFSLQDKYEYQAQSFRDEIVSSIRSSYNSMMGSALTINVAKQAFLAAKTAEKAARLRFAAGLDDVTTIVQAIQLLSTASQQQSRSLVQYNTQTAEIYRNTAVWPIEAKSAVQALLMKERISSAE